MSLNQRIATFISKYTYTAYKVFSDRNRTNHLINKASIKLSFYKSTLQAVSMEFKAMVRLLNNYIRGIYTDVSKQTIISIIIAVLYFVIPTDAIPDFLIGGFLDDITVIGWVFSSIRKEINKYLEWETNNQFL